MTVMRIRHKRFFRMSDYIRLAVRLVVLTMFLLIVGAVVCLTGIENLFYTVLGMIVFVGIMSRIVKKVIFRK